MRKTTLLTASVATFSALYVAQNMALESNQPLVLMVEATEPEISFPDDSENLPAETPADTNTPNSSDTTEPATSEVETSEQPQVEQTTEANQPQASAQQDEPEPSAAQESTSPDPEPLPEQQAEPVEQKPVIKTVSSGTIEYQYGVIQIGLTSTDGKLTEVKVLQGDTSYGRGATYTALINATLAAQGTNFGNYSGATFTTEAFRSAVSDALSKL